MHFADVTQFLNIPTLNIRRKKPIFIPLQMLPKSLMLKAEMVFLTWYIFFYWILDFYRHAINLKYVLCQNRLLVCCNKYGLIFQCIRTELSQAVEERRDHWLIRVLRQGKTMMPTFLPYFLCLGIHLQLLAIFKISAPTKSAGKE